jgi:hypothetical protein
MSSVVTQVATAGESYMRTVALTLSLAILVLASPSIAAEAANSCSDPYWKDTLRCVVFPGQVPQPNLDERPEVPAGRPVPDFTRVFLDSNPDVRCIDGTMPVMYVDKAICTLPAGCGKGLAQGDPIESNRWLFSFSGGDSCNGERCGIFYLQPDARVFMSSAAKPLLKEMEGIHTPDPVRNPHFAGYNRVRVEKCTFDRYMGRSSEAAPGGAIRSTLPDGTTISYNAYHHGFLIIEEAFKRLENGLRYTTWRQSMRRRPCCGPQTSSVVERQESLPPLADAERVLFIGDSNASHGLYHNLDHLAAELAAMPGFAGDVRGFFDENFLPSVENEAAFASTVPANADLYSSIWSGTTKGRGETFTYDGERYHATNVSDIEYGVQGAVHDASCEDAHAASGTAWQCRDRQHVLFNHVTTPFLVRQDFTDPNRDHLDAPNGHWIRWGDPGRFTYCPDSEPCDPRFNPAEFRARLEKQMETLLTLAWTKSELARGIDRTPAPLPTMFAWMPACGEHEGSFADDSFFASTISTDTTSFTLRQWIEEFVAAPRSGVRRYQVDGAASANGVMRTTRCHD